jgi:glycosyltransferase involved in cell wall biosynthesis
MLDLAGLKVCFLAGTLGQGGAERQLFYMLTALRQAGAIPRVLCLATGEHWQKRIEALGVSVTWVGQSRLRVLRLRKIIQELRRDPADILQSQHFYANTYVAAAARFLGLREIGDLRGDGNGAFGADHRILGWCGLNTPRTIVANSLVGIENAIISGASPKRLFFLPNVVDTSLFTPAPRRTKKPVHLLTVGRMVGVKRLDRFVSLVSALSHRTSVPTNGLIVGEGPLRTELQTQAEELRLSPDRLQFCGTSDEPSQIYRDADILLVTSDHEGTPNVVLEAMACGLPVVATRVGGLPALIQHGKTGYLVDPDDETALTDAVLDLVQSSEKRMAFGKYAREVAEQHHALPQLTKDLRQLYDAILVGTDVRTISRRWPLSRKRQQSPMPRERNESLRVWRKNTGNWSRDTC